MHDRFREYSREDKVYGREQKSRPCHEQQEIHRVSSKQDEFLGTKVNVTATHLLSVTEVPVLASSPTPPPSPPFLM